MVMLSITWWLQACAYTKSSYQELMAENKQSKPASMDFSLLPGKTAEKQSVSAVCHSFSQRLRVTLLLQHWSKRPRHYTQIHDNEFQLWKINHAPKPNYLSWNYIKTHTRCAFLAVVNNRGASPHAFTAAKSYTRYNSFYVWSRKAPN